MTGRSTDPVMRDITKMHESEEAADARWAEEKERLPDVFNDALQRIRDDRQAVENLGGDYLPHPDLSFRNYQSMLHGLSQCYWLTAGGFDVLIAAARGYVDDEVDSIEDALPVITQSDSVSDAIWRRDTRAVGQLVVAEWNAAVVYVFMRQAEPQWPEDAVREYVEHRLERWKANGILD